MTIQEILDNVVLRRNDITNEIRLIIPDKKAKMPAGYIRAKYESKTDVSEEVMSVVAKWLKYELEAEKGVEVIMDYGEYELVFRKAKTEMSTHDN